MLSFLCADKQKHFIPVLRWLPQASPFQDACVSLLSCHFSECGGSFIFFEESMELFKCQGSPIYRETKKKARLEATTHLFLSTGTQPCFPAWFGRTCQARQELCDPASSAVGGKVSFTGECIALCDPTLLHSSSCLTSLSSCQTLPLAFLQFSQPTCTHLINLMPLVSRHPKPQALPQPLS